MHMRSAQDVTLLIADALKSRFAHSCCSEGPMYSEMNCKDGLIPAGLIGSHSVENSQILGAGLHAQGDVRSSLLSDPATAHVGLHMMHKSQHCHHHTITMGVAAGFLARTSCPGIAILICMPTSYCCVSAKLIGAEIVAIKGLCCSWQVPQMLPSKDGRQHDPSLGVLWPSILAIKDLHITTRTHVSI